MLWGVEFKVMVWGGLRAQDFLSRFRADKV